MSRRYTADELAKLGTVLGVDLAMQAAGLPTYTELLDMAHTAIQMEPKMAPNHHVGIGVYDLVDLLARAKGGAR